MEIFELLSFAGVFAKDFSENKTKIVAKYMKLIQFLKLRLSKLVQWMAFSRDFAISELL